jgi:glycosyltransferase involved in cell wall biosynthesis
MVSRVWRAEGLAAVRDRIWDRVREARRRTAFGGGGRTGPADPWPAAPLLDVPLLNVIGTPLMASYGGVPLQLAARLAREAARRPVAILSREPDGSLRFECQAGRVRHAIAFARGNWTGDPLIDDPAWLQAVGACADLVRARAVHVENLSGLSLVSLASLASRGSQGARVSRGSSERSARSLILSVHDFAAFCRRPHLWDSRGGFCQASTDAARCRACLEHAADPFLIDQTRHRRIAGDLLRAAARIVFPSRYMRDAIAALFDWSEGRQADVIAPGIEADRGIALAARPSRRDPRQVAFLGGGMDHKGGARFATLARALVGRGVQLTVYGGYGHDNLRALRRLHGVHVRGYYRAGTLSALLTRQGASVALALSGVPESFSLALSESWAAGVPVVAPACGAFSERLQDGGGHLLSANPSDAEVLAALDRERVQPAGVIPAPPTATQAADQHLALYRALDIISDS